MNKINLAALVPNYDVDSISDEIIETIKLVSKEIDQIKVKNLISEFKKIFQGEYPGYQACSTDYHDIFHTLDATLAFVRIVHGASLAGKKYKSWDIFLGVLATLFHDTGYILPVSDKSGTGAKHTLNHVELSVDFVEKYLQTKGSYSDLDFEKIAAMIRCTGVSIDLTRIKFPSKEIEDLGKILGAADLIGQMSDRNYLEKLLFLVKEFDEGKVPGFEGELDLFKKTISFKKDAELRLSKTLGGFHKYVHLHFKHRYNIDEDLYQEAIDHHIAYLEKVLKEQPNFYRDFLRRGGIVKKFQTKYEK